MTKPTTPFDGSIHRIQRTSFLKIIRKVILFLVLLAVIFPIYWMFVSSLRPHNVLYSLNPRLIISEYTFEHYMNIIYQTKFITYASNSVMISLGVITITVIISTLGGYGLARIDIPFKKTFARGILFGYMFPPILLAIPMFILWRELGILNSIIGVILAETAVSLPFSLWIMWKFFQTVPFSLEESAQMAGASRFRAFYDIALPRAKPGIIGVAVFSFAVGWNEFTIPKILLIQAENWPLTIGIYTFTYQNSVFWGQVMAASFLMIIPPLLFVYFLQEYILRGFKAGGI